MNDVISIQHADFDVGNEHQQLCQDAPSIGAIVTFTGLVRECTKGEDTNLTLEHYPAMTEKVLSDIINRAKQRWDINNSRIIHRIGQLTLGEQIVFVGVNSPHRADAFAAAAFIMDFLKTEAPFWKKEITKTDEAWVKAKESDETAKKKWE
ncbi:MAG: molybdopterin synthase catalytic subunit [Candidatus Endobugula sp.]|jgi:molybdopterin synthase catalytic subunit